MYERIFISYYKKLLIIWFNPNKQSYYYRYVSGFYQDYYVGYKNQYGHVIIMIFELDLPYSKISFRKRILRKLISFLNRIDNRI